MEFIIMKLFFFKTPASMRSVILLETLQVDYKLIFINLRERDQYLPAFLKLNPLHTAPVLLDTKNNITITESGAMGMHLTTNYNKDAKLLGGTMQQKALVLQWYFWAISNLESNLLNLYNLATALEDRQVVVLQRLEDTLNILNNELANKKFIANEFSIADIFIYPGLSTIIRVLGENKKITKEFKNVNTYLANLEAMPSFATAKAKIDAVDVTKKLTNDELEKIIASA